MSEPTDRERNYVRQALEQDPDEYLAKHRDQLHELREEVDSDRLITAIDAVLADLDEKRGQS